MPDIVVSENVKYAYPLEDGMTQLALAGVDISIKEGSVTAILGHNGSGKSTFARLINAIIEPTDGVVIVDGMDTSNEELILEIRKTAGMVFQNPDNQLVATVVEEDVAFGPENLGLPPRQIRERVDEALEAVSMSEFKRRAPHMLSGGQKQRIAIAGVLAMKPRLIVFDEVTAMLDPRGRKEIMGIIHKLNKEQKMTVVIITHYMEEAAKADYVYMLLDGRILAQGTPKEVLRQRELIAQTGLIPPFPANMSLDLIADGVKLPDVTIDMDELTEELLALAPEDSRFSSIAYAAAKREKPLHDVSVEVQGLTMCYAEGTPFEHKAVNDVSFSIQPGEFVGIIGHTGSGKSTLLQLLSGLIKPSSGRIVIAGKDILAKDFDRKWLRRNVGVVFQYPEYQLFEETVTRDVSYGPRMVGIDESEIEDSVKTAIEMVGLDYELVKDKSPFDLSGGQKRKVAIAGVLAMEPKVLMLDEPIAGLDPLARESFMELIRSLNECGTTIIMISHNMDGLAEYASRVIAMKDSKLLMDGTPREVFSKYEELRECNLDLPEAATLVRKLREGGWNLSRDLIRYDEVRRAITSVIGGRDA